MSGDGYALPSWTEVARTPDEVRAIDSVQNTFQRVIAQGWRPATVVGATDAEIMDWAGRQGVDTVPAAAKEVLRMIGRRHGAWLGGTRLGTEEVRPESKAGAIACLRNRESEMTDPSGMLVPADHQAYSYMVIDGSDLYRPDPPVWPITEGEEVILCSPAVSQWSIAPDPELFRRRIAMFRRIGPKPLSSLTDGFEALD
ncbi:hypothetical protein [Nocardia sp. NPDC050717]|uniref:hypothetical protein n=1 Tax=Nocardia sp. NPDC050717 TaxID=3157221 RepID=UPI0033D28B20